MSHDGSSSLRGAHMPFSESDQQRMQDIIKMMRRGLVANLERTIRPLPDGETKKDELQEEAKEEKK